MKVLVILLFFVISIADMNNWICNKAEARLYLWIIYMRINNSL